MKQRFSSLDVKVTAHELSRALAGLRLANIYDISSKKLLFKFAVSGKKEQLIVDSGFCAHLTDFTRATAAAPSAFTARLRKFLKTRRCTGVTQVGTDRVIELRFSDGVYHVFLEFFAAGNVILTDAEFKILAILRNVPESDGQEPQRVGALYLLQNRQNYGGVPLLTRDRVRIALENSVKRAEATATSTKKRQKRKPGDELRRALANTVEELPPIVVDHAFAVTGFEPTSQPAEVLENEALFESLFIALEEARKVVDEASSSATCKGYIMAVKRDTKDRDAALPEAPKQPSLLYEDFQPFLPKKYADNTDVTILTYDNFNRTVDEFFSSLEGQQLESRLNDKEEAARRKLEAVKQIQQQKVEGLKQAQMLNLRKAGAIEANAERVSEAIDAVNGLIHQGMDWVNLGKLIQREQKKRNPVAEIIESLNLGENTITLLLAEEEVPGNEDDEGYKTSSEEGAESEEEDNGKATDDRLAVEINLGLTPFANAREYYDQKKVAAVKAQKTEEHSVTALRNAEKKIAHDLRKGLRGEKPILQLTRHQLWFEKFLWFLSSDGYLVVGGKDAALSEVLYKKHLRKGDVYVHADTHGAASVIIKNNPQTPDAPIPPSTLSQAGSLSVCSSNAWDSKAGMGAWWVHADQVSKSAPTGDMLPPGNFMVRGTKNILTPQPLVMGFGFLFRISEETKGHHVKHRLQEADNARTEAYLAGKPAEPDAGHAEGDRAAADAAESTDNVPDERQNTEDQAEHEDEHSGSGDEQDDGESAQRQNPLQIITDLDEGQTSSGDEEHEDEDEHDVHHDTDHVTDSLGEMSIGEFPEAMMSGALDHYADDEDAAAARTTKKPADKEDADAGDSDDEADSDTPTEAPTTTTTTTTTTGGSSSQKPPTTKRGRRAKAKKIAAKYAHQDAEDRALYEELIGTAKGRAKAAAEAAAKAAAKAEEEARRERRRAAMERQRAKLAEHEATRQHKLEAGGGEEDADDEAEMDTPLDALVGTPYVGDDIVALLPMCAPWAAMAKCKYKVKLQPGNTKKGKAIKEILERWKLAATAGGSKAGKWTAVDATARDRERMWPREVELLKALKPEEAHNVVPVGKMTVVMSGGAAGAAGAKAGGGGGGSKAKTGRGGRGSMKK